MLCVYHLVLMTGTLAVLSQALHSLVDEPYVLLIDVQSQQSQSPCGAATDAVQELKRLTHQIIVVLVILVAQKVLEMDADKIYINLAFHSSFRDCYVMLWIWAVWNIFVIKTMCRFKPKKHEIWCWSTTAMTD